MVIPRKFPSVMKNRKSRDDRMRRLKELIVGTRYERLNTQEHVTSSRGGLLSWHPHSQLEAWNPEFHLSMSLILLFIHNPHPPLITSWISFDQFGLIGWIVEFGRWVGGWIGCWLVILTGRASIGRFPHSILIWSPPLTIFAGFDRGSMMPCMIWSQS